MELSFLSDYFKKVTHLWSNKRGIKPKPINQGFKRRSNNGNQRNNKNHQKLLQAAICQQIGKYRNNRLLDRELTQVI